MAKKSMFVVYLTPKEQEMLAQLALHNRRGKSPTIVELIRQAYTTLCLETGTSVGDNHSQR